MKKSEIPLIPYLSQTDLFPDPNNADEYGVVAFGADLSIDRLLSAYKNGIFPWYMEGEPITWYSPNPRFVLQPEKIQVSRSMKKVLKNCEYEIRFDREFEQVIIECSKPRKNEKESWITKDIIKAYTDLHHKGYAHSIEAWKDGKLAGGLYGVSLGKCFIGESMFANSPNASKAAFITLAKILDFEDFPIIDCQVYSEHLQSLGGIQIYREKYLEILKYCISFKTLKGYWHRFENYTINHG